ncbi:hypothetical protein R3P38DRAFT_3041663 [Favolaschia claudopus]|uniref:Uncharacterized protein n=1 Tax=Favolaschia claudopus TaxID=2862362 RepID=A0AAW0A8R3_9AGAR
MPSNVQLCNAMTDFQFFWPTLSSVCRLYISGSKFARHVRQSLVNRRFFFHPPMSDPTQCRGRDKDGNQCICLRVTDTYVKEGQTLCKGCDHIPSGHPEPTKKPIGVGDYVRSFQEAGRATASSSSNTLPAKASRAEAEAETNAGLKSNKKRKVKPDSDTVERPTKIAKTDKAKGKEKDEGEVVEFGKLVLLACGVNSDGSLRKSAYPNDETLDLMENSGLIVSSPTFLKIKLSWGRARLQQQIEQYLPKPMEYLKNHPHYAGCDDDPEEVRNQLWLPVRKKHRTLTVCSNPLPTALQLGNLLKEQVGRSKGARVLILTSKPKIPSSAWKWAQVKPEEELPEAELAAGDEALDDVASDLDTLPSEDIVFVTRKPAQKQKTVVKKEFKKEVVDEADDDDVTDMRRAAKMRTRLSTGAITYNSDALFMAPLEDPPVAGPSTSNDDVLVISDSETPPPAPTLESTLSNEIPFAPSPSPDLGGPLFLADLSYNWAPDFFSSMSSQTGAGTSSSGAGTASSGGSSSPFPSTSSSIPSFHSGDNDGGGESSTRPFLPLRPKNHRFKTLGKGDSKWDD